MTENCLWQHAYYCISLGCIWNIRIPGRKHHYIIWLIFNVYIQLYCLLNTIHPRNDKLSRFYFVTDWRRSKPFDWYARTRMYYGFRWYFSLSMERCAIASSFPLLSIYTLSWRNLQSVSKYVINSHLGVGLMRWLEAIHWRINASPDPNGLDCHCSVNVTTISHIGTYRNGRSLLYLIQLKGLSI